MEKEERVYKNKVGRRAYIRSIVEDEQTKYQVEFVPGCYTTPIVDEITYDEEHELFLIKDSVTDKYEDERPSTVQANVYYYVDFYGKFVGMPYTDIMDGFFNFESIDQDDTKEIGADYYQIFKHKLGLQIGYYLDKRKNHHAECAKKLLQK